MTSQDGLILPGKSVNREAAFEPRLEGGEEGHGVRLVAEAGVVGETEGGDGADCQCAINGDRDLAHAVYAEDGGLAGRDDRRGADGAEGTGVRDGNGAALDIRDRQPVPACRRNDAV